MGIYVTPQARATLTYRPVSAARRAGVEVPPSTSYISVRPGPQAVGHMGLILLDAPGLWRVNIDRPVRVVFSLPSGRARSYAESVRLESDPEPRSPAPLGSRRALCSSRSLVSSEACWDPWWLLVTCPPLGKSRTSSSRSPSSGQMQITQVWLWQGRRRVPTPRSGRLAHRCATCDCWCQGLAFLVARGASSEDASGCQADSRFSGPGWRWHLGPVVEVR